MHAASPQLPALPPNETVFRLSVAQYHAMIDAGVLTEDDPVELLEGVLVQKMPKKPPHAIVVKLSTAAIEKLLPAGMHCRAQEPITLSESEPEPDLAIVRGQVRDYSTRHPSAAETLCVVEVSDTTLERDRTLKLRSYARAGIGQYWIINLVDRCVEVHTTPDAARGEPAYTARHVYHPGDATPLLLPGQTNASIAVSELLP